MLSLREDISESLKQCCLIDISNSTLPFTVAKSVSTESSLKGEQSYSLELESPCFMKPENREDPQIKK